jgi:hypothetical protein
MDAMRHTVLTVPGVTPQSFPWDYPLPRLLYKYLRPERLSVLTKCLIRFSQRQAFDDIFDLRPAAGSFGSDDEIAHYMEMQTIPPENQQEVLKHIRELGPRFAEFTVSRLKVPDEFGVLCLTDNPTSDQMWKIYAENSRGFIIAFDTTSPAFQMLATPGRVGKVEYSDEPFRSFLSTYGANAFFRKGTQYQFEREWRSIRALCRFSQIVKPDGGVPIYLAPFNPKCIRQILIRHPCSIEWDLRTLVAVDARYGHVPVQFV